MPYVGLNDARIVSIIGEFEARGMPQHVRMHRQAEVRGLARAGDDLPGRFRYPEPVAIGEQEHCRIPMRMPSEAPGNRAQRFDFPRGEIFPVPSCGIRSFSWGYRMGHSAGPWRRLSRKQCIGRAVRLEVYPRRTCDIPS